MVGKESRERWKKGMEEEHKLVPLEEAASCQLLLQELQATESKRMEVEG